MIFAATPAINPAQIALLSGLLCMLVFWGGLFLIFAIPVTRQARRRGYSGLVWFFAAICSLNPLLIFVVLTVLPDRRKLLLREKERQDLEAKLAAAKKTSPAKSMQSVPAASLGDQLTAGSFVRSLGDEETSG